MKITFCGGVERVTGSSFLIEKNNKKILVDCGMIQGSRQSELENYEPFNFQANEIEAVFVSHAHVDHTGRLPQLFNRGFKGYVYSTLATKEAGIEVLKDALKIELEEAKRNLREKFFSEDDLNNLIDHWQTVNYHEPVNQAGFEVEFFDAGHIIGSSFIKVDDIVFSGDLGNKPNFFLNQTEPLPNVDYLALESTYGDRNHEDSAKRKDILEDVLEQVTKERGVLIIPAFALERTQEILFDIEDLIENKKVPDLPIFFDSPLAIRLTEVYKRLPEFLSPKARVEIAKENIFDLANIHKIYSVEETRKVEAAAAPKIIIAGSGMIQGGRVLHHLRRYLGDPKTIVLFVGYQTEDSLGRKILEGTKEVEIEGEKIAVNARISELLSYSSHMDQKEILDWLRPRRFNLKKVFLSHGDKKAKDVLSFKIRDELGLDVEIPKTGQIVEL